MAMIKRVLGVLLSIILVCVVGGCQKKESAVDANVEELTWYFIGNNSEENSAVYESANTIIQKKIGVKMNFIPISMGEYSQKMRLKSSANENFDLCYTSDWSYNYYDNVQKGGFLPLDDILEKNTTELKKIIPKVIWEGVKIKGKIYAVPNYQVAFRQTAFIFKKELVDKYNLKGKIDNIQCMEDLTPILQVIKDNEKDIYPTCFPPSLSIYNTDNNKPQYFEEFIGEIPVGVDENLNVLDFTKGMPKEKKLSRQKLAREWYIKGFFHKDIGVTKDFSVEKKNGKFFVIDDIYKPGLEADMKKRYGYEVYTKTLGKRYLMSSSISAALTAVSRTSKNPDKAVRFIELINTDKELYNLLCFGIEGKHFKKVGEDRVEIIDGAKYETYSWVMGGQFNAYKLPGQDDDVWNETKRLNESAQTSPLFGFYVNTDNIKTEISNIKTAQQQYTEALNYGLLENYEEISSECDAKISADVEIIIKEMKEQVKQFNAEKYSR